jgi:hypothetical protein
MPRLKRLSGVEVIEILEQFSKQEDFRRDSDIDVLIIVAT